MNDALVFAINPDEAGQPLAAIVRAHLGPAAEAPLARGGVWLNGSRVANASLRAAEGAQVAVHRPPGGRYAGVDITNVDILYEDVWLIALNKRAGWYSGATPWDTWGNVLAALGRFLALREGQPP
ncbi:MAG: RluA family pseudouridine synthase, partial [Chloroflexales bacterium]|nr:RluA family pseudouridine synthase [Chloroflexales bacterium]